MRNGNRHMLLLKLTVGFLSTNCYIIACKNTREALIIDPGFAEHESEEVLNEISRYNLRIKYIINTHGHVDHISGNAMVKRVTNAQIAIHREDAEMLTNPIENLSWMLGMKISSPPPDITFTGREKIKVGSLEFEIIHTPGHTPGSISLYCKDKKIVFVGDTLFAGSIGRTDLPGGSFKELISSIKNKLFTMSDETVVYPGHEEATTIGKERVGNPFLKNI